MFAIELLCCRNQQCKLNGLNQ